MPDGAEIKVFFAIAILLTILGIVVPMIDSSAPVNDASAINPDSSDISISNNPFINIGKMFLWSFGLLPAWLDLLLLIPRIIFLIILIRLVRDLIGFT